MVVSSYFWTINKADALEMRIEFHLASARPWVRVASLDERENRGAGGPFSPNVKRPYVCSSGARIRHDNQQHVSHFCATHARQKSQ